MLVVALREWMPDVPAAALRRAWGRQTSEAITHMAGTVLATLYLGGLAWFLIAIRVKHGERTGFDGTTWTILLILLVGWALGIFVFNLSGLLHVILIVALVVLVVQLVRGSGHKG